MPQKWAQSHFSIDSIPKHILDIYIHILDCGVTRKIVLKRYKLLGASRVAQLAKNPPARKETLVGKIPWRREWLPTPVFLGFPCGSGDKEYACNAGDLGSIPGLGRSPGEGKGCPLQYSGLENPMDCIVHRITKSQTQLSELHFHFSLSCIGEGIGNPLQCSCLENPTDGGAWWAAVYGVAQSRT